MKQPFKVYRRLTPWRREEIPQQHLDFAAKRVDYLEGLAFDQNIRYLLACAYLQGARDAAEAHINQPRLTDEAISIRIERSLEARSPRA